MRIDVVTIFPEIFAPVLGVSIVKRAQASGRVSIGVQDLRAFTTDKRRTVDDRPFGGGPGMLMKPEPIFKAVKAIEATQHRGTRRKSCDIILLAAQGQRLTQALAHELSTREHVVLICGHYEGVDERVRQQLVTREVSIGDYVLTGGELPAMVLIDAMVRLRPGVIGHQDATVEESFANGLLEYPQYTRPVTFRGMAVPDVLRSGNHQQVATWRKLQALAHTMERRPDLLYAITTRAQSSKAKQKREGT